MPSPQQTRPHIRRPVRVRIFIDWPLTCQEPLRLTGNKAHYLTHVMRLQPGHSVRVFNGADGEWEARIEHIDRGESHLAVIRQVRSPQKETGPALLFAPLKKDRQDMLIEKATELGVTALQPVLTRYTIVERINLDRLRAQAIEAAEQCERLSVPSVAHPRSLNDILGDWPVGRTLLFLDERRRGVPIYDVLLQLIGDLSATTPLAGGLSESGILVGPEGGFASEEIASILNRGWVRCVSLGARILRAETAAIAALACWQAIVGDWRSMRVPAADEPCEVDDVRTE